jgi:hypothetical protein
MAKIQRKEGEIRGETTDKMKPGDRGRYIRHALASWNLPPLDLADVDAVEERIMWYFNHCLEDDMKPTVSGMCNALGCDRRTFYEWGAGNNRKDTHMDLIKRVRNKLEELYEGWMVDGKVNPVVGIFLGKNHFGYTDKQDIEITPKNPLGEGENPKEIAERYANDVVTDGNKHVIIQEPEDE